MGSYEDARSTVFLARPLLASERYSSGLVMPPHSKILRMVSPMKSRLTTMTAGVVNQVFTIR